LDKASIFRLLQQKKWATVQLSPIILMNFVVGSPQKRQRQVESLSHAKSIQKSHQFLAAAGLLQFADGLGFDLADAFAGHLENVAHFL
jgi:hypothetical protein